MTTKDLKEIRSLNHKDLQKELQSALHFHRNMSFENSQGNLKDTSNLKKIRRYIAQIRSVQSTQRMEDRSAQQKKNLEATS